VEEMSAMAMTVRESFRLHSPVDPLQTHCLFGLSPVFMRVSFNGRNSLLFSLIDSLLIRC
jgi:hypothetical protein